MKRESFFKIGFIVFIFLLGVSCAKSTHFFDSDTGFLIEIPYGFKPFNQEQQVEQNQEGQSAYHYVSKWGVLSIIFYHHEKIEADDEALTLFLKSRLYGNSKEAETACFDFRCSSYEQWLALQAILVGGSKRSPVYTQTIILDNRQTEIQVRLTTSDLRRLQNYTVKKMLNSVQFAQKQMEIPLKSKELKSFK